MSNTLGFSPFSSVRILDDEGADGEGATESGKSVPGFGMMWLFGNVSSQLRKLRKSVCTWRDGIRFVRDHTDEKTNIFRANEFAD